LHITPEDKLPVIYLFLHIFITYPFYHLTQNCVLWNLKRSLMLYKNLASPSFSPSSKRDCEWNYWKIFVSNNRPSLELA
jgi:hypothetical protein